MAIPAEIRREFGLSPGDRVSFWVEDGQIIVRPMRYTLAELQGIFKTLRQTSDDFDEEIEEAMDARAAELIARLDES